MVRAGVSRDFFNTFSQSHASRLVRKNWYILSTKRQIAGFIDLLIYLFIYCIILLKCELEFRPNRAVTPYFLFRCNYMAGINRSRFSKHLNNRRSGIFNKFDLSKNPNQPKPSYVG